MKKQNKQSERRKQDFQGQPDQEGDQNEENEQPEDRSSLENLFENELEVINGKKEKSTISRAASLENLCSYLKNSYLAELLSTEKIQSDILRVLKLCIKSDISEELINSTKILNLLCFTCPDWKDLYHTFVSTLKHNALKATQFEVRSACLETLGLFCFIFELEDSTVKECFQVLEGIISKEQEELAIDQETEPYFESALDMWSLLLTKQHDDDVLDNILPTDLESLVILLDEANLAVRLAASEAIALLYEIVAKASEGHDPLEFFSTFCDMHHLQETLSITDLQQQRKISKKDRGKQRQSFSDTLNILKTGVTQPQQVNISGSICSFATRADITKLSVCRYMLGTGFLNHMQNNPFLARLLNFHLAKSSTVTDKSEKKVQNATIKEEAKARTQFRNTKRETKIKTRTDEHAD